MEILGTKCIMFIDDLFMCRFESFMYLWHPVFIISIMKYTVHYEIQSKRIQGVCALVTVVSSAYILESVCLYRV